MTETLAEPQAPPEEAIPTTIPAPADTGSVTTPATGLEHTPGGFPVVPLSLSGTNTAAGLLATAAMTGGPIAAAIAAGSAAVLGTIAAHQHIKTKTSGKKAPAKTAPVAGRSAAGSTGRGLLGAVPGQSRTAPRTGGAGTRAGSGATGTRRAHRPGSTTSPRSGATGRQGGGPSVRQRAAQAAGGLAGGRAGQVQALRAQTRDAATTRAAARTAAVQARRQVADNRRAAKAAERTAATSGGKPHGPAARTLAKGLSKATSVRDKAAGVARAVRDRNAGRAVQRARQGVQDAALRRRIAQLKAPAQRAARKALLRSAARFQARRALAALAGGALGLLGIVTTPLGRKLGWGWLMNPGRRLYRFLLGQARAAREARDAEINAQLDADEEAAEAQAVAERDADSEEIGETVARPTTHVPAPPTSQGAHVSNVSGFRFEELAAEMEQAAQSYEPENCMEILAMLEGLPEALQAIANILKILAERSDTEFPLEKVVADMLSDLYGVFANSVDFSEELGPTFRQAHEADIARHEDPRNGYEAEKGWNV
ncbi:hypothetical protein ACIQK6_17570 [Streptomyces sp. NPDC091682]|uniref:hypothetical protein n=1 Tax=Streptomyces sp. NPDC091682 TaxID=3366005 RepID=UPI0037FA55F0